MSQTQLQKQLEENVPFKSSPSSFTDQLKESVQWTTKVLGVVSAILFGVYAPLSYYASKQANDSNDKAMAQLLIAIKTIAKHENALVEEMKNLRQEVKAIGEDYGEFKKERRLEALILEAVMDEKYLKDALLRAMSATSSTTPSRAEETAQSWPSPTISSHRSSPLVPVQSDSTGTAREQDSGIIIGLSSALSITISELHTTPSGIPTRLTPFQIPNTSSGNVPPLPTSSTTSDNTLKANFADRPFELLSPSQETIEEFLRHLISPLGIPATASFTASNHSMNHGHVDWSYEQESWTPSSSSSAVFEVQEAQPLSLLLLCNLLLFFSIWRDKGARHSITTFTFVLGFGAAMFWCGAIIP